MNLTAATRLKELGQGHVYVASPFSWLIQDSSNEHQQSWVCIGELFIFDMFSAGKRSGVQAGSTLFYYEAMLLEEFDSDI